MILQTYQSRAALTILQSGEVYKAKPSITYKGEYGALIDILNLKCECPIFCVVKGRKQNTSGKISATVKLTLDVPDSYVKLTEFPVWADFLYGFKSSKPGNYRVLDPNTEEFESKHYTAIIEDLRNQRKLSEYKYPQAIIEKINPEWLKKHQFIHSKSPFNRKAEEFFNKFRK